MKKVAVFEKISKKAFSDFIERNGSFYHIDLPLYNFLKLPCRATKGSAGHDFYLPFNIILEPGESIVIPTFMRCKIDDGWALFAFPTSGLGFKYNITLANTVGVIDSDYYYTVSDDNTNEGHIMIMLINKGDKTLSLEAGKKFCQGIFLPYGVCYNDDEVDKTTRNGGLGSTDNK